MYAKLMEVEHAIIDLEKVMVMVDHIVGGLLGNPQTAECCEKELLLLQELFLDKFGKLKTAFYNCYEQQTA